MHLLSLSIKLPSHHSIICQLLFSVSSSMSDFDFSIPSVRRQTDRHNRCVSVLQSRGRSIFAVSLSVSPLPRTTLTLPLGNRQRHVSS
ncbi:hypothetical protein BO71DRAFT_132083 [Aspergillus ellipticus CBS 707.79]|uniref:Uncharacterized protein n=1 Tax=Aspergillus ellipticus CBS 707.79 TaxID=1448320 RepID=A0A319EBW9_9EURO|nr:hypothetical protein BO71DRAFT_132083 [Aspergillus ellipticus CBS 707.79]